MDLSSWTPINLLQLLLISQSLVLSIYLFSEGRGRFLAMFLLMLGIHMMLNIIMETSALPWMPDITHAFGFSYGPLIFLFSREMAFGETELNVKSLRHLAFFIIALPAPYLFNNVQIILTISIVTITYGYLIFSLVMLSKVNRALDKTQSNALDYKLGWLNGFIISLLVLATLDFARLIFLQPGNSQTNEAFYSFVLIGLFLYIIVMSLKVLKRPEFFQGLTVEELKLSEETSSKSQFEPGHLDSITHLIKNDQLFLNPKLTLSKLADQTGYSSHELSALINSHSGGNFSDYINAFRIEYVCELLKDTNQKQRVLLDILLSSGFNSKSTFNTAFKKITGQTPTEFRNSHKN